MSSSCLVTGHRGFKGKYPENTLRAFGKCYDTGATIVETDVWTTVDDVLVVSHDVNTKRVFCTEMGEETDFNIIKSHYADLKGLRTIGSSEPLLVLGDVLHWFHDRALEEPDRFLKIHLDLKNANPPKIMALIMTELMRIEPLLWWFARIQFGIWNLRFLRYLNQDDYFQQILNEDAERNTYLYFDIFHISLGWQDSMTYLAYNDYLDTLSGRTYFKITGVSIIYISTWSEAFRATFMPTIQKQGLKLYTWLINRLSQLEYFCNLCLYYKVSEYGIISDYPDEMVAAVAEIELNQKDASETIRVPKSFTILSWLFLVYMAMVGKTPLASASNFEEPVNPEEALSTKPTLGRRIFAVLQSWEIF